MSGPKGGAGRSDIWPMRQRLNLELLDLTEVRASSPPELISLADELASLADASWALDRERLTATSARRELNLAAAGSLAMLARICGGDLGSSLIERADAVAHGDWSRNAQLTVECQDHRIVVVYGPLKTWSTKDESCRFSATVSVSDRAATAVVEAVDEELPAAVTLVAKTCDAGDLRLWHVPGFVPTQLIACGGEANTFPKHFAFFLPEDAGMPDREYGTKTVVFANTYASQFATIGGPLGRAVLEPARMLDDDAVLRTLLVWFRGHDVGHFLGPHGGHVDHLVGYTGRARGGLQECFADVIGYLLVSTPGVLAGTGVRGDDLATLFLSEMVRYFRRGWQWFPDSCAARVELRYLVDGGWLQVKRTAWGPRLHWTDEGLGAGMVALGRELVAGLLHGDQDAIERLAKLCEDDEPAWLTEFEQKLAVATRDIGDALVYGFRG